MRRDEKNLARPTGKHFDFGEEIGFFKSENNNNFAMNLKLTVVWFHN
jgi:hypothetical protein